MTVDLLQMAERARWRAGRHRLDFGNNSREQGSVMMRRLQMENGRTYNVLWTHPEWVPNGTIKGWLPWMKLPREATMLEATVGLARGANATDGVTFMVYAHYHEGGQEVWTRVASLRKRYTGRLGKLRADLSHLAGKDVSIELRVDTGPSSGQDWACWVSCRLTNNRSAAVVPAHIRLERFFCHNADEDDFLSDGDEPYLWVVYFKADGTTVDARRLETSRATVYSPRGSHSNLGMSDVDSGRSFRVPARIGHWKTTMRPIRGLPLNLGQQLAAAGVAVVAIEQDGTPESAAEAGRRELARSLRAELNEAIRNATAEPDFQVISARIQSRVLKTMRKEHMRSIWGLLGAVDPDDYVGSAFTLATYREIQEAGAGGKPFKMHFRKKGVHYELHGKFYVD